ncbi:glycosyltransferase family 2 protein [candidate division KSB1 bacterium]|nr:glycosyltransferase family 2 protein [candidate division KSB1 bacterium]RQW04130.1 MAG: glycosyltransferase family 2 protein [candidate division KSB1 bacterium]
MAVSVVIVNYNAGQAIIECIESIFFQSFAEPIEIIVVDNNSRDGSVEAIVERWPGVHVIRNADNLGFGRAANLGIKASKYHYVLLANPDTALAPNTVQELYQQLMADEDVWLSTCKIVNENGSIKPSYSGEPSLIHSFLVATGITSVLRGLNLTSHLLKLPKKLQHESIARRRECDDIIEVPVSLGALMFFNKEYIARTGYFSEDYFMYWEDVDLSLKIRKAGGKIIYNGKTVVTHRGGSFETGVSSRQALQSMVNHYYNSERIFWQKNFHKVTAWQAHVLLNVGLFIRKLVHLVLPPKHKCLVPLPDFSLVRQ